MQHYVKTACQPLAVALRCNRSHRLSTARPARRPKRRGRAGRAGHNVQACECHASAQVRGAPPQTAHTDMRGAPGWRPLSSQRCSGGQSWQAARALTDGAHDRTGAAWQVCPTRATACRRSRTTLPRKCAEPHTKQQTTDMRGAPGLRPGTARHRRRGHTPGTARHRWPWRAWIVYFRP